MSLRPDYQFRENELLQTYLDRSLIDGDYLDRRSAVSFKWLTEQHDHDNMNLIRISQLEYLGSAYAMQNKKEFKRACNWILDFGFFKAMHKLRAADLLDELSLAIILGNKELINIIAARVQQEDLDDLTTHLPLGHCAATLAAIVNVDFNRAAATSAEIEMACDNKSYSHDFSIYFKSLSMAGTCLARLDARGFCVAISRIDKENYRWLSRELNRASNGGPTEFSVIFLFNLLASTFLALASNILGDEETIEKIQTKRFMDVTWIRGTKWE